MRLHRLAITAFGPYPGRVDVDFDAVGADGLFLLYGDTGAGKTTLLDAVAFALFGTVPGARGEAKRLRCDTSPATTTTEVRLELTVQGHRLRLVRTPEYTRRKRRGAGTTLQRGSVSLTWLDHPGGQGVPEGLTRADEVGRTVQRLLGMTHQQFFQVVLLPQGEFARFLRADTADREKLLERLFGTERFADVERWFRERRRVARQHLDEAAGQVHEVVTRIRQTAAADPPGERPVSEWLAALRRDARARESEARESERRAVVLRDEATEALARARALAEACQRRDELQASWRSLEEGRGDRDDWHRRRAAARAAAPVSSVEQHRVRLEAALDLARRDEAAALAEAVPHGWSPEGGDDPRTAADRAREEAGTLAPLVSEEARQLSDTRRLAELAGKVRVEEDQLAELADRSALLPAELAEARVGVEEARSASARLDGLRLRRRELAGLLADARGLPGADDALRAAEDLLRQRVDAHQAARQDLLDVRHRRLAGMAAELATGLVGGEPCAVCGSTDHPAPAEARADPVTEDEELRATSQEERTGAARQVAIAAVRDADAEVRRLRERLGEWTEPALAEALAGVESEENKAESVVSEQADRERLADRLEAEQAALHGRRTLLEAALAATRAEHDALREVVRDRDERLLAARAGFAGVDERRAHLLGLAGSLSTLADAAAERASATDRASEATSAVELAAAGAGFPSVPAALDAALDDAEFAALESAIEDFDRREAGVRAGLADVQAAELPDEAPDLTAAREEAEHHQRAADDAVAGTRDAARIGRELAELGAEWARADAALAPVRAAFDELDALTDVVNGQGQNSRRMSLRSYVLAARLEEVAIAATGRLSRMSQGRFSFVHSDAGGSRGTRGGLWLDVLDDYSGQVRSAKTLSGGESFLASLALALGLADVVAAETGGALLDTLFIDEGFGTLDAETLDLVMNTLDDLRADGRVVGLVSHVEELRQRIPSRIRVRRGREGSSLEPEGC
ncbi:AAA family ATPase [Actinoalloteichus caeruleus]|uniref:AAA family ATPase n=1 Tax=Actinoalloteichus cyanogriseus TaxID=2893586 RepID=UPI003BB8F911